MPTATPDRFPYGLTASDQLRTDRDWIIEAVRIIEAELARSADTHLVKVDIPNCPVDVYFKDESTHPTGSLKHRLARSLFLYAICNGWIGPTTTVIESSSGSTAVSEAYFARLLGLRFVAVMPRSTSQEKIAAIEHYGAECHLVEDPASVYEVSARLAASCNGHYIDQFTYAERATDWRGNNNVAESIFRQMERERFPEPEWIVVGCGTGGTSATIGRYVRYHRLRTQLCIADPVDSVFHRHMRDPSVHDYTAGSSLIEGIGRPRLEPSFVRSVVDRAVAVQDAASIAAARVLSRRLGRTVGGTTGTNLWAVAGLVWEMRTRGRTGSIVSLLCDSGERYRSSYYDDNWVKAKGLDLAPYEDAIERLFTGEHRAGVEPFAAMPG